MFYKNPPTYDMLRQKLFSIKANNPNMRLISIGTSVLGRKIFAVCTGEFDNYTLIVSATHGLEWLTTTVAVQYLENHLNTANCVIVPMLNPDGVMISLSNNKNWQANAHGVDLNHNFNAGYHRLKKLERASGILLPCATRYGGEHFHSEPEVKAIVDFCYKYRPRKAVALHSQGEEIFYSYGDRTHKNAKSTAMRMSMVSGYKLAENDGLYSYGGLKDYLISRYGIEAFTIEIGKGENPLPITDFSDIYPKVERMLDIVTSTK